MKIHFTPSSIDARLNELELESPEFPPQASIYLSIISAHTGLDSLTCELLGVVLCQRSTWPAMLYFEDDAPVIHILPATLRPGGPIESDQQLIDRIASILLPAPGGTGAGLLVRARRRTSQDREAHGD